eukprot:CAMPEP_0182860906 /NCGR_PEP_ID=MMETSP0034_2-20130328/5195_1 /TAXON_ID=156128 /ORGANISM="Nephroselmis pyriformis, Strain CCMP717" /LENGTH=754 /DNA_ID=CAMNT_0024992777 /DNA_START=116 /DNA_END=2376 /DNA_ORIENTATION=+
MRRQCQIAAAGVALALVTLLAALLGASSATAASLAPNGREPQGQVDARGTGEARARRHSRRAGTSLEENKKKREEDRLKRQDVKKKRDEDRLMREDVKKKREEDRLMREDVKKKREEDRLMREDVKKKREEDRKKREDDKKKGEEDRLKMEDVKKKSEDVKKKREEDRKKREDAKKKREEDRLKREDVKKKSEDVKKKREEDRLKRENVKKKREEDRLKMEDVKDKSEDVKKKREEDRLKRENVKKKREEGKKKREEDKKKRKEDELRELEEERKNREAIDAKLLLLRELADREECEKHGTYTADGWCNCLWGRNGTNCEFDAFPACRTSDTPGQLGRCDPMVPKSCLCIWQCREAGYLRTIAPVCFDRLDLPPEEQHSRIPTEGEKGVRWRMQYGWTSRGKNPYTKNPKNRVDDYHDALMLPFGPRYTRYNSEGKIANKTGRILPLEECGPRECSHEGVCFEKPIGSGPQCKCFYGYGGEACDTSFFHPRKYPREPCINDCSGRGSCERGLCRCDPGHSGIDCYSCDAPSVSARAPEGGGDLAYLEGAGLLPPGEFAREVSRLKIFVYELPAWAGLAHEVDRTPWSHNTDQIYVASQYFFSALLHDCRVRTMDPEEADLFYVPMMLYGYAGNSPFIQPLFERVVGYLKQAYPFWNRTGGRDHAFFLSGDYGACAAPDVATNAILIGHWGPLHTGGKMYPDLLNGLYRVKSAAYRNCFDPKKDIVAPPSIGEAMYKAGMKRFGHGPEAVAAYGP